MIEDEAERQYRQCGRKKMYPDQHSAETAIADMSRKTHKSVKFHAFPCCWCPGWHIGRVRARGAAA